MRLAIFLVILCFFSPAFLAVPGCSDDDSGCPWCTPECNNDGICDECEDRRWCGDCRIQCTMGQGHVYEYIVSELTVPEDYRPENLLGVDLDEDGRIENKVGQIFSPDLSFGWFDLPFNEMVADNIRDGRFILLLRLFVDQFGDDESVTVQLLPGDDDPSRDATEDNLTGNGHARFHPDVNRWLHFCGRISHNRLETDPGDSVFLYPYASPGTGDPILIPLVGTRIDSQGPVDENGMIDVMVGGGISREAIRTVVVPAIAAIFNEEVRKNPDGSAWEYVRDSIDCACDHTLDGCENVTNQEGECACWNPPDDPNDPVTATELNCNALLATALKPDIDLDGDCTPDVMSIGARISAIPITIDN